MKKIILLFLIIVLVSCSKDSKYSYQDGIYCADVYYYEHKNGKRVDLTIPVEIKNNHLVKLKDEWVSKVTFQPQKLKNDTVFFTTDKEEFIGILILGSKHCSEYLDYKEDE